MQWILLKKSLPVILDSFFDAAAHRHCLAIVAMGITNTMTTVIFERFREFGILNAIGAGPGGIVSLVILESFFLGAIATFLVSLAGIAACLYLQQYGIDLFSALQQQYHTTFVFSSHDQA